MVAAFVAVGVLVSVVVVPGRGVFVNVGGNGVCVLAVRVLVAVGGTGVDVFVAVGTVVNIGVAVGKGVLVNVGGTCVGVAVDGMGVAVGGFVVAVAVEGTGVAPLSVKVLVKSADPLWP